MLLKWWSLPLALEDPQSQHVSPAAPTTAGPVRRLAEEEMDHVLLLIPLCIPFKSVSPCSLMTLHNFFLLMDHDENHLMLS